MNCNTTHYRANSSSVPGDPTDAALAEVFWRLLADEGLRADLGARGLERARAFTWEATAQATADLYRRVLAQ